MSSDSSRPSGPDRQRWRALLSDADASVRLKAALQAGAAVDEALLPLLLNRCRVEPDFFVRDTLTWAIIQLPASLTVPQLRDELDSPEAQARSQALHTLSKIGDPRAWEWVYPDLLSAPEEDVARAAWRVATATVPAGREMELAAVLATQFGRGEVDMQQGLARAFSALAVRDESIITVVESATTAGRRAARAHARATVAVLRDPGINFRSALEDALRADQVSAEEGSADQDGSAD